jgi:hypothetical protein
MFVQAVALVSETRRVRARELMRVCAALQKQASRDFEPIWRTRATVDCFERLEDVPIGYWPVIIRDDIGFEGAAGIHLDDDGQPFALVAYDDQWSLTASHEVLEMLADPFGSRLIAGDSIMPGQGRVHYLVEICDPSEAAEFGYTANGVLVSDFYSPAYFDPLHAAGVRYSFTGGITSPRQVLRGGYLSWHNPADNHWYQAQFFTTKLKFVDLGVFSGDDANSLREWIDKMSYQGRKQVAGPRRPSAMSSSVAKAKAKGYSSSTRSRAKRWSTQIKKLAALQKK